MTNRLLGDLKLQRDVSDLCEHILQDYKEWSAGSWDYNGDDPRQKGTKSIVAFIKQEVEPYKTMLEKLGTEKCPHCKNFMIDDDMNICESCNYGVHEWCTGYTYDGDGEYPAESAYAICKDCFDKAELKASQEMR